MTPRHGDGGVLDAGNPRAPLPKRRTGGEIDFAWGGIAATFTAGFACYPGTWRCAELFLNVSPTQGNLEKEIRDAGILASFALQHGASLDALVAGVTHESDGAACSIVGTALGLVRAEIARLSRPDAPPPAPDPSPISGSPAATSSPPGNGASGEGGDVRGSPHVAVVLSACDASGGGRR